MANRIRERRKELKMTQTELAEKSGISRLTIIALEKDAAKNASSKTLVALATALNDTVEHLFFAESV